ncbi:unnamed protein product [Sphagnum tenellum]
MQRFGSSGPFLPLDQVTPEQQLTPRDFFERYVKSPKRPLVMRQAALHFPASSRWLDDSYLLAQSKPHESMHRVVVETVKKESRSQNVIQLSLSEFLNQYRQNEIYMVNEVPEFLKRDVALPPPLQCGVALNSLEETVI